MIAVTTLFLIGAPAAIVAVFSMIVAIGLERWWLVIVTLLAVAVWIPCMVVDISREGHNKPRPCSGNHEVLMHKNDSIVVSGAAGRTIVFQHDTCVVSL